MKKISAAERHLLTQLTQVSEILTGGNRQIKPGFLVGLIRKRLRMSQQTLARRAKLPQPMISRIEAGKVEPSITTLKKIFDALYCDVVMIPVPRKDFDLILQEQANRVAQRRVGYLRGTMALEKQEPKRALLQELIKEEESSILNSDSTKIWQE